MVQQYRTSDVTLVPGQKICSGCRIKLIQRQIPLNSIDEVDMGTSWEPRSSGSDDGDERDLSTDLSSLLVSLGQSPIDRTKLGRKRYCEDKVKEIEQGIRKKLKLEPSKEEQEYQELLEQLKKFGDSSTRSEKLQVLSVLPQSWTIQRIEKEFGTTFNMARLSKQLVSSKGVLSTPNSRPGKTLYARTVQLVTDFYQSDGISRMMPGKKDCISMKVNGEKVCVQKRLLLSNMREAHKLFQVDHFGVKIVLTKFMELRPKNVELAGASGTHNVCVCMLHQNVKLLFEGCKVIFNSESIKEMLNVSEDTQVTYKHFLAKLSGNPPQPICFLGECNLCKSSSTEVGCDYCNHKTDTTECSYCNNVPMLKKALMETLNDMGVDDATYKAWVKVDLDTLETLTKNTDDFVDELLQGLSNL